MAGGVEGGGGGGWRVEGWRSGERRWAMGEEREVACTQRQTTPPAKRVRTHIPSTTTTTHYPTTNHTNAHAHSDARPHSTPANRTPHPPQRTSHAAHRTARRHSLLDD